MTVFTASKGQTEQKSDLSLTFLPDEVLKTRSKEELRLLRNEVYARKGYVFKNQNLNNYFKGRLWYKPNPNIALSFTDQEKKYISRIKDLENKTDKFQENKNCIDFLASEKPNVYPVNSKLLLDESYMNVLVSVENNEVMPLKIKEAVCGGGIVLDVNCESKINFKLISSFCGNDEHFAYLAVTKNNEIIIKKLYGSFGPYNNHEEYYFVLDHQDLEVTIEDWQRDQKISTRVEKYKLTDKGLVKL